MSLRVFHHLPQIIRRDREIRLSLLLFGVLALILVFAYDYRVIEIIRLIIGSVVLLFLPGYWLTKVFFGTKEIDLLERIALSFALSISVIPLLVFYLNLIGLPISARLVWGVCVVIVVLSRGWTLWKPLPRTDTSDEADHTNSL